MNTQAQAKKLCIDLTETDKKKSVLCHTFQRKGLSIPNELDPG